MNRLMPRGKIDNIEYVRVEIDGKSDGKDKTVIMDAITKSRGGVPAGTRDTAIPLSIGAQLIARDLITERGVHPPEMCINPAVFFHELEKRGIEVKKTVRGG
jgi:saccharopine dehydrogenase-like NADP-dependent oxidoreductase